MSGGSGVPTPDGLGNTKRNSTSCPDAASDPAKGQWYSRRERRAICKEGRAAIHLIGLNDEAGTVRVVALACKQRTCQNCGAARRARIREKVKAAWRDAEGVGVFLTLTLDQSGWADPLDAWTSYSTMLAGFLRYLKRAVPGCIKGKRYAWVLEPHKSGWPHAHLIFFGVRWIPVEVLQRCWSKAGGGNADIELADAAASDYLSKYIAKQCGITEDLADTLTDHRVRWFNMSHATAPKDDSAPFASGWKWYKAYAHRVPRYTKALADMGYRVYVVSMEFDGQGRIQRPPDVPLKVVL